MPANFDKFLIFLILPALLFVIYSPSLNGPFIFDDSYIIEDNPNIHIKKISFESLSKAAGGHRPVATVSFALDFYLHGLSPFYFRITNICIHILVSICLYLFILKTISLSGILFFNKKIFSAISVFVWSVHPLQIQSVTYIVQRMNSLAGLFFIISMLLYISTRQSANPSRKKLFFLLSVFSMFLSLKSKPNAVTIIPVIILYEYIFFQKNIFSKRIIYIIILIFVLILSVKDQLEIIPFLNLPSWYDNRDFTIFQNLLTESRVLIFYISLIFFPHLSRLNVDHQIFFSTSVFNPISTFASIILITFLLLFAIVILKKNKIMSFGILWFFATHSIESSIIPLDFVVEHRNYMPSTMFIVGFLSSLKMMNRSFFLYFSMFIVIFFSFWTYERNFLWKSGISLWGDSVNKSPEKSRPHESYAFYLERAGYIDKAIFHYEKAINLNPRGLNNANIYSALGTLYFKKGEIEKAIKNYNYEFLIKKNKEKYFLNIGNCIFKINNFSGALFFYQKSIKENSESYIANVNAGNASARLGKNALATLYYNRAININPEKIESYYNKALLLMWMNNTDQAAALFLHILQIYPFHKETHNNLALIYERMNETALSEKHYRAALAADPQFKTAQDNLNRILEKKIQ